MPKRFEIFFQLSCYKREGQLSLTKIWNYFFRKQRQHISDIYSNLTLTNTVEPNHSALNNFREFLVTVISHRISFHNIDTC